jgi:hypothetical protein
MYKCATPADFNLYVKYFSQFATAKSSALSIDSYRSDESRSVPNAHDLGRQWAVARVRESMARALIRYFSRFCVVDQRPEL